MKEKICIDMVKHQTQLRVRYGETDQMGYLYYGRYAEYFEVGRVELMRSMGISYKSMETDFGVFMPVMNYSTRYLRPAYYDNLLDIHTEVRELPDMSIHFHTEIFNDLGKIITTGTVQLAFIEVMSKKRVSLPPFLQQVLTPYFENHD
ncbi:MAG: thioesterase family protein [Saprospiraceae bacterium]